MKILVSGSLAYDSILDFPDTFKNHIIPNKAHILNVSFVVPETKESFGGTAGNIAYNLNLLDEPSTILSNVGNDFKAYFEWLQKNKIDTERIQVNRNQKTARATMITDQHDNQISAFSIGALKTKYKFTFTPKNTETKIAIISPEDPKNMLAKSRLFKNTNIFHIFDPGQSIGTLSSKELLEGMQNADITIANDYEWQNIEQKTKQKKEELLKKEKVVIATLGKDGSQIQTSQKTYKIPSYTAKKVIDPTGAGDAYRAGIIKSILENKSWEESGKIASCIASFAVEKKGTQNHTFTSEQFTKRLHLQQ